MAQSARRPAGSPLTEREEHSLARMLAERLSGPDRAVDVQVLLTEARKSYVFLTPEHVAYDRYLQDQLWRFKFTWLTRAVLDHFCANADKDGRIKASQPDLATHFEVSQPNVSKSLSHLKSTHFIWLDGGRRSVYQVNPLYAFRWGSQKQRLALQRIGLEAIAQHLIVVPGDAGEGKK